jgi:hypothetical protein
MAEKKGGFHALEKRIHQMEDEDRTQTQERKASGGGEPREERKERSEAPKQEPPKK